MVSFSLALQQRAAEKAISQEMPWSRPLVTKLVLTCEITSALVILQLGQFIHEAFIVLALLIIPVLSEGVRLCCLTCREDVDTQHASKRCIGCNPRTMFASILTPAGFSNFGLGHRQKEGPQARRAILMGRFACLLGLLPFLFGCPLDNRLEELNCKEQIETSSFWLFPSKEDSESRLCQQLEEKIYKGANVTELVELCDAAGVPRMLNSSCTQNEFDPVAYFHCHQGIFKVSRSCDGRFAACVLFNFDQSGPTKLLVQLYLVTPGLSIVVLLLLLVSTSNSTVEVPENHKLRARILQDAKQMEQELKSGQLEHSIWWERRRLEKTMAFIAADMLSDIVCLLIFFWQEDFSLAACQLTILVASILNQVWGFKGLQLSTSWTRGMPSDGLQRFMLKEKTFEAPMSLFVQFYSALYLKGDLLAMLFLWGSMILSTHAIVSAFYITRHISVADYDDEEEQKRTQAPRLQPSRVPAPALGPVLPPRPGMAPRPNGMLPPPPGMAPRPNGMVLPPPGMVPRPNGMVLPPPGMAPRPNGMVLPPPGMAPRPNGMVLPPPGMVVALPPPGRVQVARWQGKGGQYVSDTE